MSGNEKENILSIIHKDTYTSNFNEYAQENTHCNIISKPLQSIDQNKGRNTILPNCNYKSNFQTLMAIDEYRQPRIENLKVRQPRIENLKVMDNGNLSNDPGRLTLRKIKGGCSSKGSCSSLSSLSKVAGNLDLNDIRLFSDNDMMLFSEPQIN